MLKNPFIEKFVDFIQQPPFRLAYAIMWTALAILMLLQSSAAPVIGLPAPPGDPSYSRELMLMLGHAVVFAVMTFLWWWALLLTSPHKRALLITVIAMLSVGVLTEWLQTFAAARNPSLDDLSINWLVTMATALFIQSWMLRHRSPSDGISETIVAKKYGDS